jgi:hypothetical protein
LHGHGAYSLAYMPRHSRSGYAYAAYTSRHHRQLNASAHALRYTSNHPMKRHLLASVKQTTRHG